ncbi:MAG TPA: hypothetical protein VN428_26200 [Bryobacteraceae bacterium]|nr:hypothetical protein [Bryobacteraceae bacterium]
MERTPQGGLGRFILKVGWLLACALVLARVLAYRNDDARLVEFYMMLVLSWPASLAAVWGYAAMLDWIPCDGVAGILLMWFFFFIVGYLQWFRVVPFVVRRVRRWREGTAPVSVVPRD